MKKRSKMPVFAAALVLAIVVLCWGCDFSGTEAGAEDPEKVRAITVMTWNVQALFDGVENGGEYEEYRGSLWSAEKYAGRLQVIAAAIGGMEPAAPDVIAVQEVESAVVIQDLAAALSKHGYGWTHFANNPGMSLGVGILSRFPLEGAKVHSITINGDTAPRPVLETRITAGGRALALFVCHWKSKLGSAEATEATRRASARVILRRLRELAEQEPELPCVIMGDLNENHDEFYRGNGEILSALLPDDPRSADQAGDKPQMDFLIISKAKPPVTRWFPPEALALYSPWNHELKNGSYFYKNEWETIDHFLLSGGFFNQKGWEFSGCAVIDYPPFTNPGGYPMIYNPRTGAGLSDHLPLLLSLKLVN